MGDSNKESNVTDDLIKPIVTGLLSGFMVCVTCISYASLVFFGELEAHFSAGIGLALVGSMILNFSYVSISTYRGIVGVAQFEPALILGIICASIVAGLNAAGTPELIYPTILAAISLGAILLGVVFLMVGYLKLGNLIRFIPFPVVAGFMIGTCFLIVKGSFTTMIGKAISYDTLGYFMEPGQILKWLPGVVLGLVLWSFMLRLKHFLVLPTFLTISIFLFHAVAYVSGVSIEELNAGNWLIGPFPSESMLVIPSYENLQNADWGQILLELPQFGVLVTITMISLLLFASSLEVSVQEDVDLNSELKAAGIGNFFCGFLGAIPGYAYLSMSILSYKVGAASRIVGFTTGIVCALAIFYGAPILGLIPKVVLGGMLFYIGWSFIYEWTGKKALSQFSLDEKIIVTLVTLTIIFVGLLEGAIVGVLGGLLIFAVNYSRTNVVKYALSGSSYHSHVDRSSDYRRYLVEHGNVIHIMKLQAYIFFGTAHLLYGQVKARVENQEKEPLKLIILDFSTVTGMDSSAILTFQKMVLLAEKNNFKILFSNLPPDIEDLFERGEVDGINHPCTRFFPDLDFAIEWAENLLLNEVFNVEKKSTRYLQEELSRAYPGSEEVSVLLSYMRKVEFDSNEYMITQDTFSDEMYFIESGEVTVQMEIDTGKEIRLRKMGAGSVVGELNFYLGRDRTASVVANEKTVAYQLNRDDLARMKVKDPQASALLHEFIANMLAERLIETDDLLKKITK